MFQKKQDGAVKILLQALTAWPGARTPVRARASGLATSVDAPIYAV